MNEAKEAANRKLEPIDAAFRKHKHTHTHTLTHSFVQLAWLSVSDTAQSAGFQGAKARKGPELGTASCKDQLQCACVVPIRTSASYYLAGFAQIRISEDSASVQHCGHGRYSADKDVESVKERDSLR